VCTIATFGCYLAQVRSKESRSSGKVSQSGLTGSKIWFQGSKLINPEYRRFNRGKIKIKISDEDIFQKIEQ